jgi:hypothetical protein
MEPEGEAVGLGWADEGTHCTDHLTGAGDKVWQHCHPTLHDGTMAEFLGHGGCDT